MDVTLRDKLHAQLQLARQHLSSGRAADAAAIYDEVSDQAGTDAALNLELGHLCSLFGVHDKSEKHFRIAVEGTPDNAENLGFLGVATLKCGHVDKALEILQRAESLDEKIPQVLNGLGLVYLERAEYAEARRYFENAMAMRAKDSPILVNLATALIGLNEHELALDYAQKASKIDPRNLPAHYAIGRILAETGRTDEAIRHYEKMIRDNKTAGPAYDTLARLKKFTPADKAFINKAEKALTLGMPPRDRFCIHFALGKAYDDCRDYEKAFKHFSKGNLLQKYPYETANDRRWYKKQTKVFQKISIEAFSEAGHASEQPVFVVGMPRSGTTLLERIISSHSEAAAAGELPVLPQIAHRIIPESERDPLGTVRKNIESGKLESLAEEYLQILRQNHDGKQRIVDKLPGNYQHVGLIASMFPNAKIIHSIRNPLDTCLSCYFQAFGQVGWANDLKTIAAVYRLYRDYMAYWTKVLPEGMILEVKYESLVEKPEQKAHHIVEHCGLNWEDEILEFHRNEGIVKTVSQWQVRQPIYKSSKRRWLNYTNYINDLANYLADYLDEDRSLLEEQGIHLQPRKFGWLKFS